MKEIDLESLLLAESRKTMDVSGCKNADELLEEILPADANRISEEELDLVTAAGSASGCRQMRMFFG